MGAETGSSRNGLTVAGEGMRPVRDGGRSALILSWETEMFELNRLYNMDCMEAMRKIPDKYFQLAIVDPPYGGGGYSEPLTLDCKAGIMKSGTIKSEAGSVQGLTSTISAKRTEGTWSRKYQIEGALTIKI